MTEDNWEEMIECDLCNLSNGNPCIYFLFNDIELVYIGQTRKLKERINSHINDKFWQYNYDMRKYERIEEFNKVFYLPASSNLNEREALEQEYIENYEPKFNGFNLLEHEQHEQHIAMLKKFAMEKGCYTKEEIAEIDNDY